MTPLHVASKRGNIEALKMLIKWKANVNAEDDKGMTPLLLASVHKDKATYEEIVWILVENGASVHNESATGKCSVTISS